MRRGNLSSWVVKMPYYVYLTTNRNNMAIYAGMTNDLKRRIAQHKLKVVRGFTKRFHVDRLVFYEIFDEVEEAIKREKKIKSGSRQKKIDLIRRMNFRWEDLTENL